MPRPFASTRVTVTVALAFALASLLLHACQESSEPTGPQLAVGAAVLKTLTIVGSGTGDGTVSSSPTGINCTVTRGSAAGSGCTSHFSQGAIITLTAKPKAGHAFRGLVQRGMLGRGNLQGRR